MGKVLIFIALMLPNFLAFSTEITVYVTEEAPFSYLSPEDNKVSGIVIDVVDLLVKELGITAKYALLPMARIEHVHKNEPNSLFVSTRKGALKNTNMLWVGTITDFPMEVYKLKTRTDITIASREDLMTYSIGVVRDGGRHKYFTSDKHSKYSIQVVSNNEQNIKRFFIGRTDLLIENPIMLRHFANLHDIDLNLIEKAYALADLSDEIGLIANTASDATLISELQRALKKIANEPAFIRAVAQQ